MNKVKKILLTLFTIGVISTVTGCSNDDEKDRETEKHGAIEVPKDDPGVYREE